MSFVLNSSEAPTKLVPLSKQRRFVGPRIENNLLVALMKLYIDMDSINSISAPSSCAATGGSGASLYTGKFAIF